jgi:hypothetical protein
MGGRSFLLGNHRLRALVIVETVFLSHCLLRLSHWWLQTRLSLALYTLLLTETSGSTYLGTVTDSPHHSKSTTLYIKAAHSSFIPVPNFFCFRNALFILHRSSVGAAAWHIGCDDIRYGEGVLRVDLLRRLGLLWKLYLWLTFSQLVVLLNALILVDNLTNGDAIFVTSSVASSSKLAYVDSTTNRAIIKVDNTSTVAFNDKRNTVRISSQDEVGVGSVWIADMYHVPFGVRFFWAP